MAAVSPRDPATVPVPDLECDADLPSQAPGTPSPRMVSTPPMSSDMPPRTLLGVSREASLEEVKKAFRREARRWHPDKQAVGQSEEERQLAQQRFIAVYAAYEALCSEDETHQAEIPDDVRGSQHRLDEARANREEAEVVIRELREALRTGKWQPDSAEELRRHAARHHRAVLVLRRIEIEEEVKLQVEEGAQKVMADRSQKRADRRQKHGETEPPEPLDGPRKVFSHTGEAFQELCLDAWRFGTGLMRGRISLY